MSSPRVAVGTGTYLAFSVSNFSVDVEDIDLPKEVVKMIGTTHLLTAGTAQTFIPEYYEDPGEIKCVYQYNPDVTIPLGATQGISINFISGAKWTFIGCVHEIGGARASNTAKMLGTLTIKISGNITITPATAITTLAGTTGQFTI